MTVLLVVLLPDGPVVVELPLLVFAVLLLQNLDQMDRSQHSSFTSRHRTTERTFAYLPSNPSQIRLLPLQNLQETKQSPLLKIIVLDRAERLGEGERFGSGITQGEVDGVGVVGSGYGGGVGEDGEEEGEEGEAHCVGFGKVGSGGLGLEEGCLRWKVV